MLILLDRRIWSRWFTRRSPRFAGCFPAYCFCVLFDSSPAWRFLNCSHLQPNLQVIFINRQKMLFIVTLVISILQYLHMLLFHVKRSTCYYNHMLHFFMPLHVKSDFLVCHSACLMRDCTSILLVSGGLLHIVGWANLLSCHQLLKHHQSSFSSRFPG